MASTNATLDDRLRTWIASQHLFFVASAPLAGHGHVNCSPKGLDSFRVLGPQQVAFLDLVGSGAETIAHVRENGRIVVMFCAFEGAPKILRLHGRARVVEPQDATWGGLLQAFGTLPNAALRAVIVVDVERVAESCGYGVPLLEYRGERQQMAAWAEKKGEAGARDYQRQKNATSLDGLPALRWVADA